MMILKDMVHVNGSMEKSTKVLGKQIRWKEKVSSHGRTINVIRGN